MDVADGDYDKDGGAGGRPRRKRGGSDESGDEGGDFGGVPSGFDGGIDRGRGGKCHNCTTQRVRFCI